MKTYRLSSLLCVLFFSFFANNTFAMSASRSEEKKVWVVQADGSLQCQPESGIRIEQASDPLLKNQIQIFDKQKKNDNKTRIMLCGTPTGRMNAFLILESDLEKAKSLGFVQWVS